MADDLISLLFLMLFSAAHLPSSLLNIDSELVSQGVVSGAISISLTNPTIHPFITTHYCLYVLGSNILLPFLYQKDKSVN